MEYMKLLFSLCKVSICHGNAVPAPVLLCLKLILNPSCCLNGFHPLYSIYGRRHHFIVGKHVKFYGYSKW